MVDRIRIETTIYMPVGGGQWDIVLPGSVFDVADASAFSGKHVTILSPTETPGALSLGSTPSPVRFDRRKK